MVLEPDVGPVWGAGDLQGRSIGYLEGRLVEGGRSDVSLDEWLAA